MTDTTHEATFYVQVRGHRHRWWPDSLDHLSAVKVTQSKPTNLMPGCVAIKLKIRIPDAAFNPFEPEVIIDVPVELVQRPIEVEAVDAS